MLFKALSWSFSDSMKRECTLESAEHHHGGHSHLCHYVAEQVVS